MCLFVVTHLYKTRSGKPVCSFVILISVEPKGFYYKNSSFFFGFSHPHVFCLSKGAIIFSFEKIILLAYCVLLVFSLFALLPSLLVAFSVYADILEPFGLSYKKLERLRLLRNANLLFLVLQLKCKKQLAKFWLH